MSVLTHNVDVAEELLRLQAAGRLYPFVAEAHRALATMDCAPRLVSAMLRTLMDLGLGGPARELVEMRTELSTPGPLDAARIAMLPDAPDGLVPWTKCRTTFERNVAALIGVRPEMAELVESLPARLAGMQLYQGTDGSYYPSTRSAGAIRQWLPALTDSAEDERTELPSKAQQGAVAIVGLRAGGLLQRVVDSTSGILHGFSLPIYLIEPDLARFAAWLHIADLTDLLGDPRVYLFVGDDACAELERTLSANVVLGLPATCLNQIPDQVVVTAVSQAVQRAQAARTEQLGEISKAIQQRYETRDQVYWARRFKKRGLVLGLTSRHTTMLQYSMRDTLAALRQMGWRTEMLIESQDHHQFSNIELCRQILELDPVLVIMLDHLRYEAPVLPKNLPVLTWIQDPMPRLLCPDAGASIGPFDFVCGYYNTRCINEFGYPSERFKFAPIPVCDSVFHDGPVEDAAEAEYACDVSFVSNASTPAEQLLEQVSVEYPDELRPMLKALYQRVQSVLSEGRVLQDQTSARTLVCTTAEEFGLKLDDVQIDHINSTYAHRLFDWGRRQETLHWVADWARRTGRRFRIFGLGWENHPTLGEFAAGVIEHGEPLRCLYRCSKLALQLISAGFKHQRALEILASGALPLTRYRPVDFEQLSVEEYVVQREAGLQPNGIATMFPQLERIVFHTPDEFSALAERYLADPALRKQVCDELRAVVLRDFTYSAVVGEIMQFVESLLERQAAEKREAESCSFGSQVN